MKIKIFIAAIVAFAVCACAKVEEKKENPIEVMTQQLDKAVEKIEGTHNYVAFRKAKKEFWETFNKAVDDNAATELTEEDAAKIKTIFDKLYDTEQSKLEKFGKKSAPTDASVDSAKMKIDSVFRQASTLKDISNIDRITL